MEFCRLFFRFAPPAKKPKWRKLRLFFWKKYQLFINPRNEQRSVAAKISELQQDLNEHKIVIETLEGVDGDRKCFR